MAGTIRSWIHYLQIRTGVETQLEHRRIAETIRAIFKDHLPTIHEALLCPESTSPSAKPVESQLRPQRAVTIGTRLKEFFEKPVRLLGQYREVVNLCRFW